MLKIKRLTGWFSSDANDATIASARHTPQVTSSSITGSPHVTSSTADSVQAAVGSFERGGFELCSCCLPPERLRMALVANHLRRLHHALSTPFAPGSWTTANHLWLLHSIWRNLRPGEPFERTGVGWQACGFQGKDPATDVRGGGLLAVQCLEYVCKTHAGSVRAMLAEVEHAAASSTDGLRFYPLMTTAINLVSKLCDALGLSEGMRGPISSEALETRLLPASGSASAPLVNLLVWPMEADANPAAAGEHSAVLPPRGPALFGRLQLSSSTFFVLFSLLVFDFHVRFSATRRALKIRARLRGERALAS